MTRSNFGLAMMLIAALSAHANAAATITQGATAPTYSTTLTFDESGGPVGQNVPNNSWAGPPYHITSLFSGEGSNFVGNNGLPTAPNTTNSYYGPFGVTVQFANDITEMSLMAWDSSGPPSPFGGGLVIALLNNGDENNPVAIEVFNPAYGGVGDPAFNITTNGGTVFDEVRIFGNGFFPETFVDNLSWNIVPEPSCGLFLALSMLLLGGGRRWLS